MSWYVLVCFLSVIRPYEEEVRISLSPNGPSGSYNTGVVTHTNAVVVSMSTEDLCSLNAVDRKHPNVKQAKTVNVNAKIVFALAKIVFIFVKIISDNTTKNM